MNERLYGSDPEYFIYNEWKLTEHGNLVEVIPPAYLLQDLKVPFTVTGNNNKRTLIDKEDYKVIEDGAALEFNFKKPFKNSSDVNKLIYQAKNDTNKFLSNIDRSLKLSTNVLGFFNIKKYAEGRDESFLDAIRFGCDADIFPKLYMLMGFEQDVCKIVDASKHEYRYCGGHFHMQNMSKNKKVYITNFEHASIVLDFFIGTTNVLANRNQEIRKQELARLKYYGRPGRCRIQNYSKTINGIEYRPPSNQWISDVYSIDLILKSGNIAGNIIENNKSEQFYNDFKDRITEMWDALTFHNRDLSSNILADSLMWALDKSLITLEEVETVYGKL